MGTGGQIWGPRPGGRGPDDRNTLEKLPDQKDMVNFKIYDIKAWETNNCNTCSNNNQYLKK